MSEDPMLLNLGLPDHVREAHAIIDAAAKRGGVYRLELIRVRDQKTLAQGAYLFGVVYPLIARGLSEAWGEDVTVDEVHLYLKTELKFHRAKVRRDTGETVAVLPLSFADATKEEASRFIHAAIAWAHEQMMIRVPPPEQYREQPAAQQPKGRAA